MLDEIAVTLVVRPSDANFETNIRRAAREASIATWILVTNSAFDVGPKKTTKKHDRFGGVAGPYGIMLTSTQQPGIQAG